MKGYKKNYIKLLLVVAAFVLTTVASVLPVSAHVGITPGEASQGGYGTFIVKVPNEDANASTSKLEIQFPDNAPFAAVRVKPKTGWTYKVEKKTLDKAVEINGTSVTEVVSTITWEGGKIAPGEFDEFSISMGPLPTTDKIELKALQTYDNGDIVRWVDETKEGEEEPEHPAPTIMLSKAAAGEDAHGGTAKSEEAHGDTKTVIKEESKTLSYVAIGLGAVALILALGAFAKKK